jgi:hypothetical protein
MSVPIKEWAQVGTSSASSMLFVDDLCSIDERALWKYRTALDTLDIACQAMFTCTECSSFIGQWLYNSLLGPGLFFGFLSSFT